MCPYLWKNICCHAIIRITERILKGVCGMSKFTEYIGSQFGNPRGMIGNICCVIMNIINKQMYRKTVSLLQKPPGSKILDVGYGNGYFLHLIDRTFDGYMLYGIDVSADMKLEAEKKNKKAIAENRLQLEIGDCCNLPFPDGMFDAVTSINTVYFWKDTVKGLKEIRRCLAENGSFYNVVYTKQWLDKLSYTQKGFQKFEPASLAAMGCEAGFREAAIQDIVKGKSFAVIYSK